jgi:hypothetical protein
MSKKKQQLETISLDPDQLVRPAPELGVVVVALAGFGRMLDSEMKRT